MKRLDLGKGITISTPWLTAVEAAAYCGMSRERFSRAADNHNISWGGSGSRCYHVTELDRLLRIIGHYEEVR